MSVPRPLLALWMTLCCATAWPSRADAQAAAPAATSLERSVASRGSVRIDGRNVPYTATAGTLTIRNAAGHPTASVFYIAYTARGRGPSTRRPITFAYNGGPGVSSTSLNIGAFGPKIVVGPSTDRRTAPGTLIDNPDSLLADTDLVFVDEVGTGFSRIAGSATAKDFYGVDEDANAFVQFIERYARLHARRQSPTYLLGLSYGTMRSAVVADDLEKRGTRVSGIVLMSTVLDFPAIAGGVGQDLRYWLYVPTEAMIASYYRKAGVPSASRHRFVADARAFAAGPYAAALERGDALPDTQRRSIARRLHTFTGIPVDSILSANLRVAPDVFARTLLADRHETIGRYDGRVAAPAGPGGDSSGADPSTTVEAAAIAAAAPNLLRTLHYVRNDRYVLTSLDVNERWNWGEAGPSGTNVTGELAEAMMTDPRLRVLSLNGYYDLATPFFGTQYQLAHLGVPSLVQRRIAFEYYAAGHMIFVDPKARAAMKADLHNFYLPRTRNQTTH